jgi:hypothetical protein
LSQRDEVTHRHQFGRTKVTRHSYASNSPN